MSLHPQIRQEVERNGGIITANRAVELGFSKALLPKYAKEGALERVCHGIYCQPDRIIDDMYLLTLRSSRLIFSHETALFLNGLSERTPFIHSVTLPSDVPLTSSMRGDCICYYVKPEFHTLGLSKRKTTFGNFVPCYNAERTVCDILRSRSRMDAETVISGIQAYARSKEKNLALLGEYAEKLRVKKILKGYLEVLL